MKERRREINVPAGRLDRDSFSQGRPPGHQHVVDIEGARATVPGDTFLR